MPSSDVVGKAVYGTEVDRTGLAKGLAQSEKDVIAAGDKAEKEAAARAERTVSKISKISAGAAGAVGAALVIGVVSHFADLERAQADFQRETGATAAEATKAGKAINDMAARNIQPIAEIGATLAAVTVNWGLHGDAAATAAEKVLKYAQATGQDATGAVSALDDVLDSWNLKASDSQTIMDKLVLSHQRYGGSITDNQKVLADLAPAMRAANLTYDDGIGLLNMFAAAGVDAAAAPVAITKALTKVKSTAQLKAMIADIVSIKDPFERAAKATDLFGAKAGPKLAMALSNGGIEDYIVSLEDAKGATDAAAEASLTLADKVKMAFGGITSDIVDAVGPAGPVLQAFAGLSSLLGPVVGKAGKTIGVALGAAISAQLGPEIAAKLAAAALPAGTIGLAAAGLLIAIPIVFAVKSLDTEKPMRTADERAQLQQFLQDAGKLNGGMRQVDAVATRVRELQDEGRTFLQAVTEYTRQMAWTGDQLGTAYSALAGRIVDGGTAVGGTLQDTNAGIVKDFAKAWSLPFEKVDAEAKARVAAGMAKTVKEALDQVVTEMQDPAGNRFHWVSDPTPADITAAATGGKTLGASYVDGYTAAVIPNMRGAQARLDALAADAARNDQHKKKLAGADSAKAYNDAQRSKLIAGALSVWAHVGAAWTAGMEHNNAVVREKSAQAVAAWRDAVDKFPGIVTASMVKGKIAFRTTLADARDTVRLRMAELDYALRHPLAGQKLADFYAGQIRKAQRQRDRAQREGNISAVAIADKLLADLRANAAAISNLRPTYTTVSVLNAGANDLLNRAAANRAKYREHGGPVTRGMPYIVGERGPELIVPSQSGTVIPNGGSTTPGRWDIYVHDEGGGLARAGIGTASLADQIAARWRH